MLTSIQEALLVRDPLSRYEVTATITKSTRHHCTFSSTIQYRPARNNNIIQTIARTAPTQVFMPLN